MSNENLNHTPDNGAVEDAHTGQAAENSAASAGCCAGACHEGEPQANFTAEGSGNEAESCCGDKQGNQAEAGCCKEQAEGTAQEDPGADVSPESGANVNTEPASDANADQADAGQDATTPETENGEAEAIADNPLAEAMNTISNLEDQLKRAQASLYNTEQEYSNYVRRSKQEAGVHRDNGIVKVIDALLPVLDDVELARQHGDLTGPTGLIAEKIEQILDTNFGLKRFGKQGDVFNPERYDALMHRTSADVTDEIVETLIQPGYVMGEKLIRAARVGVVSPE